MSPSWYISVCTTNTPPYYVDYPGVTMEFVMRVAIASELDLHLSDINAILDEYSPTMLQGKELMVLRNAAQRARDRIEAMDEVISVEVEVRYFIEEYLNARGNPVTVYEVIPSVDVLYLEGPPRTAGEPVIQSLSRSECLSFLDRLLGLTRFAEQHGYAVEFRGSLAMLLNTH